MSKTKSNKSKNGSQVAAPMSPPTLMPAGDVVELPVVLIDVDPEFNARKAVSMDDIRELAKAIKRDGLLQPVGVTRKADGRFALDYGFCRFTAISGKESEGFLGRPTIKAVVAEETKEGMLGRMYRNLAENVQRANLTPYDLAKRLFEMTLVKDENGKEMTGTRLANRLGKSVGYVNNLVRCYEKLAPSVVDRWKLENDPVEGDKIRLKVCTTDQLNKLVGLSFEEQDLALKRLLGEVAEITGEDEEGEEGEGGVKEATSKKAGTREIKAALKAAEERKKSAKNTEQVVRAEAVADALRFVLGIQEAIKGIYIKGQVEEEKEDKGKGKKS